jgi:ribose 5-phosphate isomerase B
MIALGSDHAGLPLKQAIKDCLTGFGYEYKDFGCFESDGKTEYPVYALKTAQAVAGGECERGILFCGTGVGISIAANKVKGVRCAVCTEPYSALMSREHNNANMLALGARVVGVELAKMIVKTWLDGTFSGGAHATRVDMIKAFEETGALQ